MENQIFEPIEVIAFFHDLKIDIIKFKWKNDVYHISRVNSRWKIPKSDSYEYHFSVLCDRQKVVCEISYDMSSFKWQLVQYEYYL